MPPQPDSIIPDYQSRRPTLLIVPPLTIEEYRWRLKRILLRVAIALLLSPLAFYFGPNLLNFGKLTSLAPADFVPTANTYCVPVVIAIKQYQRDHRSMPTDSKLAELVPVYLRECPPGGYYYDQHYTHISMHLHRITYDFATDTWSIRGPFVNGTLPLPPVVLPPATATATTRI